MPPVDRPVLSLADLEAFDPRAPEGRKERRFCCPLPGPCEGKPKDATHRCLSVNLDSGAWNCPRCGASGQLRERWREREQPPDRREAARRAFALPPEPPPAEPHDPDWRQQLRGSVPIAGTPGAVYLAGRGIPTELAAEARIGYSPDFYGRPAVLYLLQGRDGKSAAVNGRHLDAAQPKAHTAGDKRLGVFATPGALASDPLTLVEGPADALSWAAAGFPAVALGGVSAPAWLPRHAAFRRVLLATDADAAGDTAAVALTAPFQQFGARVERLRPAEGCKDWNDVLVRHGAAALRAALLPIVAPWSDTEADTIMSGFWQRVGGRMMQGGAIVAAAAAMDALNAALTAAYQLHDLPMLRAAALHYESMIIPHEE